MLRGIRYQPNARQHSGTIEPSPPNRHIFVPCRCFYDVPSTLGRPRCHLAYPGVTLSILAPTRLGSRRAQDPVDENHEPSLPEYDGSFRMARVVEVLARMLSNRHFGGVGQRLSRQGGGVQLSVAKMRGGLCVSPNLAPY